LQQLRIKAFSTGHQDWFLCSDRKEAENGGLEGLCYALYDIQCYAWLGLGFLDKRALRLLLL
jgi:hypothetical protein